MVATIPHTTHHHHSNPQKKSDMAEETNKIIHDGDAASKILLAPTGFVPRERRGVAAQHPPPAASVRRNRRRAAMLSLVTLLCPPSSSRSGGGIETSSFEVVGLVNVAPPIAGSRPTAPMRGGGLGCRRNAPFFNSPDATTMTDSTALSPQVAAAAANQTTGYAPPRTNQKTDEQVPPRKNDGKQIQRRRVWMPPSQNPGKIFSIQQPQDLLDFVIEDERLSVGESRSIRPIMLSYSPFFSFAQFTHPDIARYASESLRQLVQNVPSLRHALSKIGLAIRR